MDARVVEPIVAHSSGTEKGSAELAGDLDNILWKDGLWDTWRTVYNFQERSGQYSRCCSTEIITFKSSVVLASWRISRRRHRRADSDFRRRYFWSLTGCLRSLPSPVYCYAKRQCVYDKITLLKLNCSISSCKRRSVALLQPRYRPTAGGPAFG